MTKLAGCRTRLRRAENRLNYVIVLMKDPPTNWWLLSGPEIIKSKRAEVERIRAELELLEKANRIH